jgi:hypothetical protein
MAAIQSQLAEAKNVSHELKGNSVVRIKEKSRCNSRCLTIKANLLIERVNSVNLVRT